MYRESDICYEYENAVVIKVKKGYEVLQLGATVMYVKGYYGRDYFFRAVCHCFDIGPYRLYGPGKTSF